MTETTIDTDQEGYAIAGMQAQAFASTAQLGMGPLMQKMVAAAAAQAPTRSPAALLGISMAPPVPSPPPRAIDMPPPPFVPTELELRLPAAGVELEPRFGTVTDRGLATVAELSSLDVAEVRRRMLQLRSAGLLVPDPRTRRLRWRSSSA